MKNEKINANLMIFEGKKVEVFEFNGKVLFNPKHVAECLDIKDVNSSIRSFNEKQVVKLTNSKMHNMQFRKLHNTGEKFLTESGVYKLIFKSKKAEAERFQDWVTDEVLPSIRKHGAYLTDKKIEEVLSDPDTIIKLATELKEERQARTIAEDKVKIFLDTDNLMEWNVVAKNIGIGRNDMLKMLREEKILQTEMYIKNGKIKYGLNHNTPYQAYMKYFKIKYIVKGSTRYPKVLVTAKGQEYLYNKLINNNKAS